MVSLALSDPYAADGDCSHEIKRRLLLGKKVMTNLGSILRSRDITLPTKVCLVKASGITLPKLPLLRLSLQIETHPSSFGHATLWADGILVP